MARSEIIDVNTHLQRDAVHSAELRRLFVPDYHPAPGEMSLGTVDEAKQSMSITGVAGMNFVMMTWAGKYYRDGQYVLPDDPSLLDDEEDLLRSRVRRRVVDNNEWAVRTAQENPEFTCFIGISPTVMNDDEMVAEIEDKIQRGASGVMVAPVDMGLSGGSPRLFAVYDYCQEREIPVFVESSARSKRSRPAHFSPALEKFPRLRVVFAHVGGGEIGQGPEQELLELGREYDGVFTETSSRLADVANGIIAPDDMVAYIRTLGSERVMYGSNYVLNELAPRGSQSTQAPEGIDPRFVESFKLVEAFRALPLGDDEYDRVAAGNFRELTGSN